MILGDATTEIYYAQLVEEESTRTVMAGPRIVIEKKGLFCALYSDQGSHFTSPKYLKLAEDAGVKVSMDGKGRAFDNIFTERLWKTIKYECVYLHDFENPKEARVILAEYIDFYNNRRLHASLAYHTPAEVHFGKVALVG